MRPKLGSSIPKKSAIVNRQSSIKVVGYLHATILVRNLERTRKFYTAVLGLKEIQRPGLTFPGTWFAIGEQELHIVVKDNLEGDPAFTDDRHIALAVADFDDLPARLEAQNIPFRRGSNPARKQIFFRDPDGNLIELQPGRIDD